ncbi:Clavaminate synthase-like protein, partial [Artomyces pyxidatus]
MAEYGYPPFSDEVSVADLIVVDYTLLVQGDADEIEKLWQAATELGMWYLKNHGVENEVEGMFGVAEKTLMLPRREKKKYAHWKEEGLFGYNLNKGGRDPETKEKLELAEYINIAKDDILSYPTPVYRTYPSPIADNIEATIRPFVQKSCNVTDTLLEVFNDKLGLPQGTLAQRHSAQERSSSQVRLTRSFGNPAAGSASLFQPHNDYGLLAFSYARLGGLLVMGKGWISWKWVKPIPGHAVCIVGETLDTFT